MRATVVVPWLALSGCASIVEGMSNVATRTTPDSHAAAAETSRLDDGRAINLRCSREGRPVVLLVAGGNMDSSTWFRVQPSIADTTMVCAYDRAGYGFSTA